MTTLARIVTGLHALAGSVAWAGMLAWIWLMCFPFAIDWYRHGDWLGVTLTVGIIVGLPVVAGSTQQTRSPVSGLRGRKSLMGYPSRVY
ncbi:hypothetical protein PWF70_23585 (plasmid) [Gordonia sp. Swx-4]|uniref:hypothetical protein n=1 Tax=Gordonia sp. Swx-4 TaxID=3029399 RepID=UPI0025727ADB|nr:hypothetical protein [Gordonia sp. Swx-4]WJG15919.1 hypothetical protein PWF70_23585 [Gordonia sp. Swx-4]